MRKSDIKVGATYINKGKGRTKRKVLEISDTIRPRWFGYGFPNEPGVRFEQISNTGRTTGTLYLHSFAAWCKEEVPE